MKKIAINVIVFFSLIFIASSLLASESLIANASSSVSDLKAKEEVVVTLKFDQYQAIKNGINAYKATLIYDKNIFEEVLEKDFVCQNDWEELKYNKDTGEFVAIKKAGSKAPEEVVKVTLKAKEGVKASTTDVKFKDIVTSDAKKDINLSETKVTINIIEEQQEKPEEPIKPTQPEKITSQKYTIEEGYISRILPKTTVQQFKQNVTVENVTTNPQMVFTDANGNVLQDNSLISTGTKLKVGSTLQFTLVVTGDADGDSEITINDMAKVKLHLIETKLLTGIELKAADVDNDKEITINDLAQIKLILIDLFELK